MQKIIIITVLALYLLAPLQLSAMPLRFNYTPYSFSHLENFNFKKSPITLLSVIEESTEYTLYQGIYTTMQRKMTLVFGVPKLSISDKPTSLIIMVRDFQNHFDYISGQAIALAAKEYLRAGFAIVAPDFFGFNGSDEPPMGAANSAEALLIMPINVAELYVSFAHNPIINSDRLALRHQPLLNENFSQIAFWAQGDGGLVALHTLAILREPIPTILWAPVTVDFARAWAFARNRYSSIAGKNAQAFIDAFESNYDMQNFAIKNNLHRLAPATPILLHHGDQDEAVPKEWSDQFSRSVESENLRRNERNIAPIRLTYKVHPAANHQLEPYRSTIFPSDIAWLQNLTP